VIRVVIDSSVLLRYLIRPGAAIRELIEEWWLGNGAKLRAVQMVTAPELIAELEGVLARPAIQALIQVEEGQALLDAIGRTAEVLAPLGEVPSAYTRDPKDDKFVACALLGEARYLVTVDRDLLALEKVGDVRMITPYDLLTEPL